MKREPETAPNVEQAVPLLMVADLEKSLQFYVAGLGFAMTNEWIDEGRRQWCRLRLGGAALMLQQYRPGRAPEGPLGSGVSICFQCRDALAVYRRMRSRGLPATRPFVGNQMWVAVVRDPDGYKLDFESPTDVPEGTELPEQTE